MVKSFLSFIEKTLTFRYKWIGWGYVVHHEKKASMIITSTYAFLEVLHNQIAKRLPYVHDSQFHLWGLKSKLCRTCTLLYPKKATTKLLNHKNALKDINDYHHISLDCSIHAPFLWLQWTIYNTKQSHVQMNRQPLLSRCDNFIATEEEMGIKGQDDFLMNSCIARTLLAKTTNLLIVCRLEFL